MSNLYDNRSKKAEHGGLFAVPAVAAGQEIEMEKTVNAPYEALKVYGKSEQKAKWNQAEGITSQVQEDGYNLLNCNVEWEPSAENQGISNIQSGVGSISFDYLHDHSNYPYIRTKGTMHLKPGIYTISGIASGDPLDSVGFSQGEPDGYRQVVGDCNGTITIETEGDYRFYVYPMGEDRLASYELTNLMVTEGDTSKTYQEYGYSKPSPAYPSELTSHISAGSYQIPTENGIYEVTLTEDLRGLDDTYRDKICFDSISGTGYLEQNTQKHHLKDNSTASFSVLTDDALHFAQKINNIDKSKIKVNQLQCSHFKHISNTYYNGDNIHLYVHTDVEHVLFFDILKEHLDITDFSDRETSRLSAVRWLNENDPIAILPRTTPLKTALTFTKVESSTLPVLPWTAYGKQLIPFEPYTTNGTGSTTKGWPAPPFVLGETYYFGGGVCDDGTAINSNNSAFIILKDGVQVYNKSPNRAITITEDLLGADTVRLYTNSSLVGKTVTQFTGELGSSYSGSYEPFNSTPPESLTSSPDYPQQIYDLKDVTVTSRGRNLATAQQVYYGASAYLETTLDDRECVRFQDNKTHAYYGVTFKENMQYTVSFEAKCVQQASTSGTSLIFRFFYTDGTNSSITASSNTAWKEYVLTSTAGKTVSYIGLSSYNYVNFNYIDVNTFQLEEGTERTPFDKYRCTSATIPLTLRSCGDDKDYIVSDGQAVNLNACVKEVLIDGTLNNFVCNIPGSSGGQRCQFYVKSNVLSYDRLKQDSLIENSHGFETQVKSDGANYLPYIIIPWSVLGLTSAPTTSEANEAAKSYCAEQNALGTPFIIRYVLNIPVKTDYTAETWAQDMIGLKTAPYWTKIYTDKETGGLKAQYLSIQWNDNETGIDYLITSDGEKVVTNDRKIVILF